MEIKDAVAVVTGGASGLGFATAKALLDEGAKVVILDLPSSRGEEVAAELGERARFWPSDEALLRWQQLAGGEVDIVYEAA